MTALMEILEDLEAEGRQLDGWVTDRPDSDWATVTTPEGWTVAHQIGHLHWTDCLSVHAIEDPDAFGEFARARTAEPRDFVDVGAAEEASKEPAVLLECWRVGRGRLAAALQMVPEGEKVPWFGPPMSPTSMATARLMETWAHAQDVAESLHIEVPRTDRVRHVCHIGVRTRGYVHLLRGEPAPTTPVRVELVGPSGDIWTWGPDDAAQRVVGDAWDFALLATRRRHRDDVEVRADGSEADHWLDIVQTFAGDPGADPRRLSER